MSLPLTQVQQALMTKLAGDALLADLVDAIYDTAPQRAALPYLTLGRMDQEHVPMIGEALWQVTAALEVWTEPAGRKTALSVLERLQSLLHYGALSMTGYDVREMRVVAAECALGEQATRLVGTMEIQLVVAAS